MMCTIAVNSFVRFVLYKHKTCLLCDACIVVEFLSYVNLQFHFTLMQKFKFWYQLEDNSIRSNFGPSVQRSFQLGGQGAPPGDATHRTYGNRCIS